MINRLDRDPRSHEEKQRDEGLRKGIESKTIPVFSGAELRVSIGEAWKIKQQKRAEKK